MEGTTPAFPSLMDCPESRQNCKPGRSLDGSPFHSIGIRIHTAETARIESHSAIDLERRKLGGPYIEGGAPAYSRMPGVPQSIVIRIVFAVDNEPDR